VVLVLSCNVADPFWSDPDPNVLGPDSIHDPVPWQKIKAFKIKILC
jgi:hypothetical protein